MLILVKWSSKCLLVILPFLIFSAIFLALPFLGSVENKLFDEITSREGQILSLTISRATLKLPLLAIADPHLIQAPIIAPSIAAL